MKERVVFKRNICKGCGLCTAVCPKGIVTLSKSLNAKGYHYAEILEENKDKCISCAFCATMCPDCAIEVYKF